MPELRFGGGINQLDDELVNADECVEGENFQLDSASRQFRPRDPFTLKGTATSAEEVSGIMQLVTRADVLTTLVQTQEFLYSWDGVNSFTPVATVATNSLLRDTYWSLDDLLILTDLNKATTVRTWNGSAIATLTHAITGVTNLYAKYGVVFQNRLWLFNVTTDATSLPHVILASAFEDHENFDNANTPTSSTLTASSAFFLVIPDLRPINGVAVFFNTIVISTVNGALFKLTGTDATDYAVVPLYPGSSAAGDESIVNTGDDVMYIRKGGNIERLISSDTYGDTETDDLSTWIRDEAENLTGGIAVYDQAHQLVLWFIGGFILVLDKNSLDSGLSPWMKWTTNMVSALDVSAAKYLRVPGTTNYSVYFGGPQGQIYDVHGSGASDAGSTLITVYRKSKLISELNTVDDFVSGRVHYRRKGVCNLVLDLEWSENYADSRCVVPLLGPITSGGVAFWGGGVYWGGDHYWNQGGVEEFRVSTSGFSAAGKSPSFFLTVTITSTVDFLVNKIEA